MHNNWSDGALPTIEKSSNEPLLLCLHCVFMCVKIEAGKSRVVRSELSGPSCPVSELSGTGQLESLTASSCPPSDNSVDLNASSCPPSDNSASLGHDKLIPSYPLSIIPCRRTQKPFKSNDASRI